MHAVLHLFSDCLQLSSKALGLRLPLDHELVLPGFQPLRYLHDCSDCFRLERLPGGVCTHWKAPPLHGARQQRKSLSHSITASARSKNASGIVRPIAFAVLRLTARSNFVGCSIGMSFGCLPCRILCTNLAPCRKAAGPSAPHHSKPPISPNARGGEAAGIRCLIASTVHGFVPNRPRMPTASTRSLT